MGVFPQPVARIAARDTESAPKAAIPPPVALAPIVQQQIPVAAQAIPAAASAAATDSSGAVPAKQEADQPKLPKLSDMVVPGEVGYDESERLGHEETYIQAATRIHEEETEPPVAAHSARRSTLRAGWCVRSHPRQGTHAEKRADPSGIRSAMTAASPSGIPSL